MFKVFVLLALTAVAFAVPIDNRQVIRNTCALETGADIETYNNYRLNHIFDDKDHSLKCMQKCTLYKHSIVNIDGLLDLENAANFVMSTPAAATITRDAVVRVLANCNNAKVDGDACVKAFTFRECIWKLT